MNENAYLRQPFNEILDKRVEKWRVAIIVNLMIVFWLILIWIIIVGNFSNLWNRILKMISVQIKLIMFLTLNHCKFILFALLNYPITSK